jgi:hypothetical protein
VAELAVGAEISKNCRQTALTQVGYIEVKADKWGRNGYTRQTEGIDSICQLTGISSNVSNHGAMSVCGDGICADVDER